MDVLSMSSFDSLRLRALKLWLETLKATDEPGFRSSTALRHSMACRLGLLGLGAARASCAWHKARAACASSTWIAP